ncbi:hypothetical protein ACFWQG_13215 [Rhodococcus sp. NPDC058532]
MLTAILQVQMDLIGEALAAGDLTAAGRESAVLREILRGWAA